MSNKKYTNVQVNEIHTRLMRALNLSSKTDIAKLLNISIQTLKNREARGVNSLDDVELLCRKTGVKSEWVFLGEGGETEAQLFMEWAKFLPPTAKEKHVEYCDPIAEAFLKDWLKLSDVVKMRVWTLVKEELEKQGKMEG